MDGNDSLTAKSRIIDQIQYCQNPMTEALTIKPYVCDIEGSLTFCECVRQDMVFDNTLPRKEEKLKNCTTPYDQHWLIISFPWYEHIFIDDLNSKPVETYFNRIFIHEAPDIFIEIPTKEKSTF